MCGCVQVVDARYGLEYINVWERLTIPRYCCIYHLVSGILLGVRDFFWCPELFGCPEFFWVSGISWVSGCVCLCSCCVHVLVFMLQNARVHVADLCLCSCCGLALVFMLCTRACVHVVYVRLCSCCGRRLVFILQLGLVIRQPSWIRVRGSSTFLNLQNVIYTYILTWRPKFDSDRRYHYTILIDILSIFDHLIPNQYLNWWLNEGGEKVQK